jgi:DNA-binding transcriptional LysR family regulator
MNTPIKVELRHLRYFVAVAENAGFTSAARQVGVSQQVLSTQVRQLEDELGVELLRRGPRGVSLTAAGAAFLESARSVLAGLDRGVTAARNAAAAVTGALTVGLQAATGGVLRTAVLAAFAQACPGVLVKLVAYDMAAPAAGLLDRGADVALLRPPVAAPGLMLKVVGTEPRVFVLASGHPLARRPVLTMTDVAGLPWIAAPPAADGCEPEAWRDDWLGVPRPDGTAPVIGAQARTIEEWREHVATGRGISLCPESSEAFSQRPGITFVPARGVPPTSLCVGWRVEDARPVVASFVAVAAGLSGIAEASGTSG